MCCAQCLLSCECACVECIKVIDVNGEDQARGSDLWTMDGEERTQSLGPMDQEARGWTMMDSTLNNNEQEHMEMVMKKCWLMSSPRLDQVRMRRYKHLVDHQAEDVEECVDVGQFAYQLHGPGGQEGLTLTASKCGLSGSYALTSKSRGGFRGSTWHPTGSLHRGYTTSWLARGGLPMH